MRQKPKTSKFCTCGWLERAAAEPSIPIAYDEKMHEFHLLGARRRPKAILWHCPMCGCKARESRRASFFENVSDAEMERLRKLVKPIKTLVDARRILGEPDEVIEPGGSVTTPESKGEPRRTTLYGKSFRWLTVSKTAVVFVEVPTREQVSVGFHAKPNSRDRRE